MTPDKIQKRALETWYEVDHPLHADLRPSVMGLAGESGELLDLLKKHLFKPGYLVPDDDFINELGDVLYYTAIVAHQLGLTLDQLSQINYQKLKSREKNGTGYNRGKTK